MNVEKTLGRVGDRGLSLAMNGDMLEATAGVINCAKILASISPEGVDFIHLPNATEARVPYGMVRYGETLARVT